MPAELLREPVNGFRYINVIIGGPAVARVLIHLRNVRSYEKLTSEDVLFMGPRREAVSAGPGN